MNFHGFFNLKKAFFLLTICFVISILIIFNIITKPNIQKWSGVDPLKSTSPKNALLKVFHLDLKGGAPKIDFLSTVLPIIQKAGANAILIEYEDMFPFFGNLKNISAKNSYMLTEVIMFIELAESLNMEVIPLIQTFGHLEYTLKLKEFEHLREQENFPQEICPLNTEAVDLIKEMIIQIMRIHANARYIHLGCDEIRHLALCPRCSRINPVKIFSRHVTKIANFVKTNYPGVTPLIWDDQLREWNYQDMKNSGLNSAVELVVWVYGSNIFNLVPSSIWNMYQRVFPKIWLASAFKGAFGETQILPDLDRHLKNNLSWKRFLYNNLTTMKFRSNFFSGIFITGWSRYDHFAALCELLPVGIPSLLLSLLSLESNFKETDLSSWLNILHCPQNLRNLEEVQENLGKCSFPGSDLYDAMTKFIVLKKRAEEMIKKVDSSGWVSRYNVKKNFTSPWRVLEMFPNEGLGGEFLHKDFRKWRFTSLPIFYEYFDKYTIDEWFEENFDPMEEWLKELRHIFQRLIGRKTWPRRPFR